MKDVRRSTVVKRSLVVAGHATSISLEDAFWSALKAIAEDRGCSVAALVADIDDSRMSTNLSSAIRVFVLEEAQSRVRLAHVEARTPSC